MHPFDGKKADVVKRLCQRIRSVVETVSINALPRQVIPSIFDRQESKERFLPNQKNRNNKNKRTKIIAIQIGPPKIRRLACGGCATHGSHSRWENRVERGKVPETNEMRHDLIVRQREVRHLLIVVFVLQTLQGKGRIDRKN